MAAEVESLEIRKIVFAVHRLRKHLPLLTKYLFLTGPRIGFDDREMTSLSRIKAKDFDRSIPGFSTSKPLGSKRSILGDLRDESHRGPCSTGGGPTPPVLPNMTK